MKRRNSYPPGWNQTRVKRVIAHYEGQSPAEAAAEDEAAISRPDRTGRRLSAMRVRTYDFSKDIRRKYLARMLGSATVVLLDSDVAEIYQDSKAVNAALREHAGLMPASRGGRKRK